MSISKEVVSLKDYIIGLRRFFHQCPELSGEEYETALKIEEALDALDIPHKRIGATGIMGRITNESLQNQSENTIVLRADIDALKIEEANEVEYKSKRKGVMHACGHDGHIAALLGAANILNKHKEELTHEVILLFQPAEEIGAGAKTFLQLEEVKKAKRILGMHLASFLPKGQILVQRGESNASCDYFKIKVKGKSCHVSKPQDGIDALYIASQLVVALQAVAARMTNPLEPVVVGIGTMTAGTNYNIVANEAILEGTTRAFNPQTRKKINEAVQKISEATACAYGAEVEVQLKDYASPLINDLEAADEVIYVAKRTLGEENVLINGQKNMMADDFAEYLNVIKGCYFFVGSSSSEATSYPHHHERFAIDEEALLVAAQLFVTYVLEVEDEG